MIERGWEDINVKMREEEEKCQKTTKITHFQLNLVEQQTSSLFSSFVRQN